MANNPSILELTFNHIAFPPKLPGTRDAKIEAVEKDILTRLRTAVHTTKAYSSDNDDAISAWECIEKSLEICQHVNGNSFINREALQSTLQSLDNNDTITIILHVTEQNAGLTIRSRGYARSTCFLSRPQLKSYTGISSYLKPSRHPLQPKRL